jgi:hypothetical protein
MFIGPQIIPAKTIEESFLMLENQISLSQE